MLKRTKAFCIAAMAVVSIAAAGGVTPARADATGAVEVACTAFFPTAPGAPTWTPGGTCNGTATLVAHGTDTFGLPFRLLGSAPFAAGFSYTEPCLVNGQPPWFLSFANGTFTITAVAAEHPLGVPTTATLAGAFMWRRVGLHPAILISGVTATFANGGAAVANLPGVGTASFAPPTNFNPFVHVCGVGGPLTIDVVIAATLLD